MSIGAREVVFEPIYYLQETGARLEGYGTHINDLAGIVGVDDDPI